MLFVHALMLASGALSESICTLSDIVGHNWTWIPPEAFQGGVWPNDHECIFQFHGVSDNGFTFTTPPTCVQNWHGRYGPPYGIVGPAHGTLSSEGDVSLRFVVNSSVQVTLGGWMAADCELIDTTDGGMYVRGHAGKRRGQPPPCGGLSPNQIKSNSSSAANEMWHHTTTTPQLHCHCLYCACVKIRHPRRNHPPHADGRSHPMDFAPHEYLRLATAWVLRSSIITFPYDGSKHLTPGIPVAPGAEPHYYGYWMRK